MILVDVNLLVYVIDESPLWLWSMIANCVRRIRILGGSPDCAGTTRSMHRPL